MSIAALLDQLDAEIRQTANAVPTYDDAVPTRGAPASEERIAELASHVGHELPEQYRELLRICDGYTDVPDRSDVAQICGLFAIADMLPGSSTRAESDEWRSEMADYSEWLANALVIGAVGQRHVVLDPAREMLLVEVSSSDESEYATLAEYLEARIEYCGFVRSIHAAEQKAEAEAEALRLAGALPEVITAAAFSPDGAYLAAGCQSGAVLIFTPETTRRADGTHALAIARSWSPSSGYPIAAVQFLDARRLLVRVGSSITQWNPETGEPLEGALPNADSYAFAPRSGLVASGDCSSVKLSTVTGEKCFESEQYEGGNDLIGLVFTPDEKRLLFLAQWGGTLYDFDVERRQLASTRDLHGDDVKAWDAVFAPSLTRVAVGDHGSRRVRVFDVATGAIIHDFADPARGRSPIAFHPRETFLARGGSELELFALDTGALVAKLPAELVEYPPSAYPTGERQVQRRTGPIAWSPDGELLVAAASFRPKDGIRVLVRAELDAAIAARAADHAARTTGALAWPVVELRGHTEAVATVEFHPERRELASFGFDRAVRLWRDGAEVGVLADHPSPTGLKLAFHPAGHELAATSNDKVERRIHQLASIATDVGVITIWDLPTQTARLSFVGHTAPVGPVVYSCDGARLYSGSTDRTIKIWNPATGDELATLEGHDGAVFGLAIHPSGLLASASVDHTVRLWEHDTCRTRLTGHTSIVNSVSLAGDLVASGSDDGTLKIWDLRGELLHTCPHEADVNCVRFDPQGNSIATACHDGTVRLWEARTGTQLGVLVASTQPIYGVGWSHDGTELAAAGADRVVRIWRTTSRQ